MKGKLILYIAQERAFCPNIVKDWKTVITYGKNGRLVKKEIRIRGNTKALKKLGLLD